MICKQVGKVLLVVMLSNLAFGNTPLPLKAEQINVKAFGAKGDGIHNDSYAVQNAINAGANKTIIFPAGTYLVKNLKGISNIVIDGTGVLKTEASAQIDNCLINFTNKTNITIRNITLDGNKGIVPGSPERGVALMQIWKSESVNVTQAHFKNNAYLAISLAKDKHVFITNCSMVNTDCAVITQGGCSDIKITNNNADGGTSDGFVVWGGIKAEDTDSNITITKNMVKNKPAGSGYLTRYAQNVTIANNTAIACSSGATGMDFVNASLNCKIRQNTFIDCDNGVNGIFTNSLIENNSIKNSGRSAIWLGQGTHNNKSENNIIRGNTIVNFNKLNSDEAGIRLSSVLNCVIENNTIDDDRQMPVSYVGIQLIGGNPGSKSRITNNSVKHVKIPYIIPDSLRSQNH